MKGLNCPGQTQQYHQRWHRHVHYYKSMHFISHIFIIIIIIFFTLSACSQWSHHDIATWHIIVTQDTLEWITTTRKKILSPLDCSFFRKSKRFLSHFFFIWIIKNTFFYKSELSVVFALLDESLQNKCYCLTMYCRIMYFKLYKNSWYNSSVRQHCNFIPIHLNTLLVHFIWLSKQVVFRNSKFTPEVGVWE